MEENGYTSLDEIERDHGGTRTKDITVCGKKFLLRSWTAAECQEYLSSVEKNPRTVNQRIIVGVVEKPKFTKRDIERLSKIDGAFIAQLARACMTHVGIEALEDAEETEKN